MTRIITALLVAIGLFAFAVSAPVELEAKRRSTKKQSSLLKFLKSGSKTEEAKMQEIEDLEISSSAIARGLALVWEDMDELSKKKGKLYDRLALKILEMITEIEDKKIWDELHEDILDTDTPTTIRDAYFQAVIDDDDDDAIGELCVKLADDQYTEMRIVGIEELGERTYKEGFEVCMNRLNDAVRRVQTTALDAVEEYGKEHENWKEAVIEELILNFMQAQRNKGTCLTRARKVLEELTDEDLGGDPAAWLEWWRKERAQEAGKDVKGRSDGYKTKTKKVWDVDTSSTKLVFVIDTSISMEEPIKVNIVARTGETADEKKRNKGIDWTKVKSKLDLARAELKQYINMMEPDEYFTIVSYNTDVKIWEETIVSATEKNIESAHKYLNALSTGKLTNIYGSLNRAFKVAEDAIAEANSPKAIKARERRAKKRKKKKDAGKTKTKEEEDPEFHVPDTIIFLTDGYATAGEYKGPRVTGKGSKEDAEKYAKSMKEMLKELKARNRKARMTIHAVAIGDQPDKKTLKQLARENRGDYRHITEGSNVPGRGKAKKK